MLRILSSIANDDIGCDDLATVMLLDDDCRYWAMLNTAEEMN